MALGAGLGAAAGGASASMVPALAEGTTFSMIPAGAGMFETFPAASEIGSTFSPMAALGGAQEGYKMGSMADELLGTGKKHDLGLPQTPAAPLKKPLIPTNPTNAYSISTALSQLPPELRTQFQALFQGA